MQSGSTKRSQALEPYSYRWPREPLDAPWSPLPGTPLTARPLAESAADLELDSRWPGFFSAPLCFVTAAHGGATGLEKVVGANALRLLNEVWH